MRKFIENAREPRGLGGKLILNRMNKSHSSLSVWGLGYLQLAQAQSILDIGCGGGANLGRLLAAAPQSSVFGVDYSAVSVKKSLDNNRPFVRSGRLQVVQSSVSVLPFDAETFNFVTAFETVYFWPSLETDFLEVHRVMKKGGRFLVCNEAFFSPENPGQYAALQKMLDMNIYSIDELTAALSDAGFVNIESQIHQNGRWLAVVSNKL